MDFEVEATGRNVARVSYATSLMKKGVLISTTEHLLSAFVGMGIDNAFVELDNLELPILDGSARPFVDLIRKRWHPQTAAPADLCPDSSSRSNSAKATSSWRCIRRRTIRFPTQSIFRIRSSDARLSRRPDQRPLRREHRPRPHFRISPRSRSHAAAGLDSRRVGGECDRADPRRAW